MRTAMLDTNWLKTFKKMAEEENSGRCSCFCNMFKNIHAFFISLGIQVTLRAYPTCMVVTPVLALNMILSIADFFLLVELLVSQYTDIISIIIYLAFYPLIVLVAPIFGLVSMISCKANLYRLHAYLNAYTMINTLVMIIVSIIIKPHSNFWTGNQLFLFSIAKLAL